MSKVGKTLGLPIVNARAACIDIGARIHVAAAPPELSDDSVRAFWSFTADIEAMANWLVSVRITTVATGSTSVYWIPAYEILEEHGSNVVLANAPDCKAVPGQKTMSTTPNGCNACMRAGCCGRASIRPGTSRRYAPIYADPARALFESYQDRIVDCDQQIEDSLRQRNLGRPEPETKPPAPRTKTRQINTQKFNVRAMLYQLTATDLTSIHGLGPSISVRCCCATNSAARA